MNLTTTAEIREAIKAIPRDEWDALAVESGVPRSTIEKIAYGVTSNPGFDAAAALAAVLMSRSGPALSETREAAA